MPEGGWLERASGAWGGIAAGIFKGSNRLASTLEVWQSAAGKKQSVPTNNKESKISRLEVVFFNCTLNYHNRY